MNNKLLNNYNEWVESLKNSKNENILSALEQLEELNELEQEFVFTRCYMDINGYVLIEKDDRPAEDILVDAIRFYSRGLLAAKYKYIFRVKVKGLEKYITREIAIPKNMTLGDLGVAIILAFRGECSHLFQFVIDKKRYVLDPREAFFDKPEYVFGVKLLELDWNSKKKYTFVYDFGDNYEFSVQFVKEVDDTGNYPIEVLKGKGYGIWEDNHYYLDAYYDDPNTMVEDWDGDNVKVKDFIDFDPNDFCLLEINEMLNDLFEMCREHYINEEDEEGLPF